MHSEGALGALFRDQKTRKFPQKYGKSLHYIRSPSLGFHTTRIFPIFEEISLFFGREKELLAHPQSAWGWPQTVLS